MRQTTKGEYASGHGESMEQIEQRFRRWRETRVRGERIPPALWAAAVGLARQHGLHRVAHDLGVDYAGLKRRLERAGGAVQAGKVDTRFVELLVSPTALAAGRCECTVELENARGARMRVELNGNGLGGLAGLCTAFWSGS